jgi:neutral ceramidase
MRCFTGRDRMSFNVGVARKIITPRTKVELAGLGYYLERTWESVRDDLAASALVIGYGTDEAVAIVTLDLMYPGSQLTASIRERVAEHTGISPASVCVHCSHTHNAPTATTIRGAGEADVPYLEFVADRAAAAIIEASGRRQPARLYSGSTLLEGITFNRTRDGGPVDTHLNVLSAVGNGGERLAVAVNFHAHPCALMEMDFFAVSRDVPGEAVDRIEAKFPGAMAFYFQGTCGDINIKREYSWPEKYHEPGRMIADATSEALTHSKPVADSGITVISEKISVPTRRWTAEEISADREEGAHRFNTGDISGWAEGMARNMVVAPLRLPPRYNGSVEKTVVSISRFALEWTTDMLAKMERHPESVDSEIQIIRIGNVYLAAHPAELFTSLGLEIRQRWPNDNLLFLGYSNDGIGYIPDEREIERRGYAAITSPKNRGEFPYTADAGKILVEKMIETLHRAASRAISG